MTHWYRAVPVAFAATLLIPLGCSPSGSTSECSNSKPCDGRGEVCENNSCVQAEVDLSSTDPEFAGGDFGPIALPFFRGTVCAPRQVQSGSVIPFKFEMCVHPCVAFTNFKFSHHHVCDSGVCSADVLAWLRDAAGTACANDAFGKFSTDQCVYVTIDASLGPITANGGDHSGAVDVEIPYLSNADIAEIEGGAEFGRVQEIIQQYPQDPSRVITVDIEPGHPAAPESCSAA